MHDPSGIFTDAAEPLEQASRHYESEHALLEELSELIEVARVRGYTAEDRTDGGRLLSAALAEDRLAIASIETALAIVKE